MRRVEKCWSGAVGLAQAATAVYPGFPERLEISGTGGAVVIEAGAIRSAELADERGEVGAYGAAAGPTAAAAAGPGATAAADPAAVADEAHRAQLADFLAALDHGGEPLVTGEQARADLAVIRAVYDSARLGRPVTPQ